jgi:phosphatidylinositol glycan class O
MGLAVTFLPFILAPALISGSAYWIIEWADSASVLGDEWTGVLRLGRTWVARFAFGWLLLAGGTLWALVPLCLNIEITTRGEKREVKVLGYANAFGAPYLLFWTLALGAVYMCTQLTGQLVLALATVALIAYLEVLDSVRDVKGIEAAFLTTSTPSAVLDPVASAALVPAIRFGDVVPVALLGLHAFYGTGHQSTISSLQWKSAFVLTPTVGYPWSVVTVVLNSVGPFFVFALAVPLVALWNKAPLRSGSTASGTNTSTSKETERQTQQPQEQPGSPQNQVESESTLAGLGIMIYYSALLLGTAVSAAILRRHLMVWKVFAPAIHGGSVRTPRGGCGGSPWLAGGCEEDCWAGGWII